MTAIRTAAPTNFRLAPWRRREALLARLRHRSLDRRLAAGEAAHLHPLLAVRAAQLTTACSRDRIAARWDELGALARARTDRETADQVNSVAEILRADRLVLARGVAYAATMAGTAAAALNRIQIGGEDLVAAVVRTAIAGMG